MRSFTVRDDKGQTFEVDEEKAHLAEKDGFLPVVTNGKEEHRVSFNDMQLAAKDGFSPLSPEMGAPQQEKQSLFAQMSSPEMQAKLEQQTKDTAKKQDEVSETGRNAIGNALTLDYLPQLKAKTGQVLSGEGLSNNEDYIRRRDLEIAREKGLAEKYPDTHAANTAIGVALPIVASMGLAAPAAAAEGIVAQGFKAGAKRVLTAGAKGAATGAGFGFAGNPGDEQGVVDPVQLGKRLENAKSGAAVGTALGVGPAAIAEGAPAAVRGAKWLGKKAVSVFLGPSGEAIDAYIANPAAINGAKSVEAIKDGLDESLSHLFTGVENAKVNSQQAKDALIHVERQVREVTNDANFKFNVQKADAKEAITQAQAQLDKAFSKQTEKLASTASPLELQPQVADSIKDLKERTSRGSAEAYAILDKDPNAYSVRGAAPILRSMADEMNIQPFEKSGIAVAGSVAKGAPVTSETKAVQSQLEQLASYLENTPEKIPAREAKKILQQLDASEKAAYGQPGFDSRVGQAYKKVRATIDAAIKKQNPEYEAKMLEVASDADLFGKAVERFGDERGAASRLNSIHGPTAEADRELLAQMGKATGRDFESHVNEFSKARATLKDPKALDQIKSSLPESRVAEETSRAKSSMTRPEAQPAFVEQELAASGVTEKHAAAQKAFAEAHANLEKAQADLEPFKSLTPASSQNAVKGLMKTQGKESIELRRKMQSLDKTTGKTFVDDIQNRRMAEQFEKQNTNGSRNAVMYGSAGAAVGGAMGGPTAAAAFGAVGAQVGGMVDKYGPQIAKRVLDKGLKVQGIADALLKFPELAELAKTRPDSFKALTATIRTKIESGGAPFSAASRKGNELDEDSSVPASYKVLPDGARNETPLKGRDKWASDGLEKIGDKDLLAMRSELMSDPKSRELLVSASKLKPGSKFYASIISQLKARAEKASS